jgi:hypothetical protein
MAHKGRNKKQENKKMETVRNVVAIDGTPKVIQKPELDT